MNKIPYEERKLVYEAALQKYGFTTQAIVAIEELSELQKEVCKTLRGIGDREHVAEEIADATIILEQLRLFFNLNQMVCDKMDEKVSRLKRRVEND